MAKDKREIAKEMYFNGSRLTDIADKLEVPLGTVSSWKSRGKWERPKVKKKRGGQLGNKNAVGNKGGPPLGSKNAETHGFYSKWLPEETAEILGEVAALNPIDLLWDNIKLQHAAILRAQRLMFVKDQADKTVEAVSVTPDGSEVLEIQQAWDKQANFLNAQSRAMKTLEGMIKNYEDLVHRNWDMASEEQKLRIDKLRQEISLSEQTDAAVRIVDDI